MIPPNDVTRNDLIVASVPMTLKMVAARFPKDIYRRLRLSAFEHELSIQAFLIAAVLHYIEYLAKVSTKFDA